MLHRAVRRCRTWSRDPINQGGAAPLPPCPRRGGRRDGSRSRHPSMPNRVVASGSRQGFVRSHLAFGSPLTAPRTLQNRAESTIVDGRGRCPLLGLHEALQRANERASPRPGWSAARRKRSRGWCGTSEARTRPLDGLSMAIASIEGDGQLAGHPPRASRRRAWGCGGEAPAD